MKKIFLIGFAFLLLFISSCSYPAEITEDPVWNMEEVEKVIKDNIKGECNGSTYNIKLNDLIDEEVNPYYKTWEKISLYPLKEYQSHRFELIYFNVFSEYEEQVLFHVYIEDEVIEYDIQVEEVVDEITGEIKFVETKVETGRYTETIDLIEGGRKVKLNPNGKMVDFYVDYIIKDYSASTSFEIVITDLNGDPVAFEWGIDDLGIVVSEINPDE